MATKWHVELSYHDRKEGSAKPSSTFRPLSARRVRNIVATSWQEHGKRPMRPATAYVLNALLDEYMVEEADDRILVELSVKEVRDAV